MAANGGKRPGNLGNGAVVLSNDVTSAERTDSSSSSARCHSAMYPSAWRKLTSLATRSATGPSSYLALIFVGLLLPTVCAEWCPPDLCRRFFFEGVEQGNSELVVLGGEPSPSLRTQNNRDDSDAPWPSWAVWCSINSSFSKSFKWRRMAWALTSR